MTAVVSSERATVTAEPSRKSCGRSARPSPRALRPLVDRGRLERKPLASTSAERGEGARRGRGARPCPTASDHDVVRGREAEPEEGGRGEHRPEGLAVAAGLPRHQRQRDGEDAQGEDGAGPGGHGARARPTGARRRRACACRGGGGRRQTTCPKPPRPRYARLAGRPFAAGHLGDSMSLRRNQRRTPASGARTIATGLGLVGLSALPPDLGCNEALSRIPQSRVRRDSPGRRAWAAARGTPRSRPSTCGAARRPAERRLDRLQQGRHRHRQGLRRCREARALPPGRVRERRPVHRRLLGRRRRADAGDGAEPDAGDAGALEEACISTCSTNASPEYDQLPHLPVHGVRVVVLGPGPQLPFSGGPPPSSSDRRRPIQVGWPRIIRRAGGSAAWRAVGEDGRELRPRVHPRRRPALVVDACRPRSTSVERDHAPFVVEHRRSQGAALGVGEVPGSPSATWTGPGCCGRRRSGPPKGAG